MKRNAAFALASAIGLSPNYAQAAGNGFDGKWNAAHECKDAPGGGDAFTVFYSGNITNGNINITRRKEGVDGYFHLTGHVNSDGTTSNLHMAGQTGLPKYNVRHVKSGIVFDYPVTGSFTPNRAVLQRADGVRDCTITLTRG